MANRPPRLDRVFQCHEFPLYFVTFNAFRHAPLLANALVHSRFVRFANEAQSRNIAVGRYVIMPTHIHLFVSGPREFRLQGWVRQLKRALSSVIGRELPHWQEGFFDHLLRGSESYSAKWEYVRQNPVRAKLVITPEQWPYQGEITRLAM